MPDHELIGKRFQIDIDSRQRADMEAARILKEAIESGDSYLMLRCMTSERSKTLSFDGTPHTLGDVMLSVSERGDAKYEMFMILAMAFHWVESATGFPRPALNRAMMVAVKVLDKLEGGRDAGGNDKSGQDAGDGPDDLEYF